jgi:DNA topoisomerase IB
VDDGLETDHQLPAGLRRSDVHGPGYQRIPADEGFEFFDQNGIAITSQADLNRIRGLAIPPAWQDVWISPDPAGHIQATGVDARGRRQYRYHPLWRAERDTVKFGHMLRFAAALPAFRTAALEHLGRRELDRERVSACALRVTELGLFRIGSERYAQEDHTYGVASLERRHVSFSRGEAIFDYVAKESKHRTIRIADAPSVHTLRALHRASSDLPQLFVYQAAARWEHVTTGKLTGYLHVHAGSEFTVKEFRTWNATLLAALALSNAPVADSLRARRRASVAAVRHAAEWLGDTPAVARASYIDPAVLELFECTGSVGHLAPSPAALPADPDAEHEVLRVLQDLHAPAGPSDPHPLR